MAHNTDEDRRWALVKVAIMKRDVNVTFLEELTRLLPDPADQALFSEWCRKQSAKNLEKSFLSPEFFVETVEQMNFFFPGEKDRQYYQWKYGSLDPNSSPRVPLGSSANALYRLEPDVFSLHAKKQTDVKNPLVMEYCFLGVNTNVSPRFQGRRQMNKPEESQHSAESNDSENGFMFHQLGEVTTWPIRDEIPADDSPIHDDDWTLTGFVLVARLSTSGRTESLYLIYNTWPYIDEIGDRVEVTNPDWGRLPYEPKSGGQLSFARLRGSLLSDRDYHTPFEWDFEDAKEESASKAPVELVRLVEKNDGSGFLRLTVHRSTE